MDARKGEERRQIGAGVAPVVATAFRVEALFEEGQNDFGDPWEKFQYLLLFDVENRDARRAAKSVRSEITLLGKVATEEAGGQWRSVEVRVCSTGAPVQGQVCGRLGHPPPKKHVDVTDVPVEKPDSNVPLTKRDRYWLTPIEVPFYDALRETGAIFAVQPWVQGVDSRFRPDFIVFYDGGGIVVELDGHEGHKTREQRIYDARRQRWFEARKFRVLRWAGSEVHANPQDCVRELLEVLRGKLSRF